LAPTVTCFSGRSTVEGKDIGHIQMAQLRIGDLVKSHDNIFTQVYGFSHVDRNHDGIFLHFTFDSCSRESISPNQASFLEISKRHLVVVEKTEKSYLIPAGDVIVGDILSGKRVTNIKRVVRSGIYAPLTQSGYLLVSGVLVSNYVDLLDRSTLLCDLHQVAHTLFYPQQLFCHYYIEICKKERYFKGYGILAYPIIGSITLIQKTCERISLLFPFVPIFILIVGMVKRNRDTVKRK
jgi:Hint module